MTSLDEAGETDLVYDATLVTWTLPAFSSLSAERGKFYASKFFSCADAELYFLIYPGGSPESVEGYVSLIPFRKKSKDKSCIQCEIGLKSPKGFEETVVPEHRLTFGRDGKGCGGPNFFRRAELLRRLAPSDVLTLVFKLRRGAMQYPRSGRTFKGLEELWKLSKDFLHLMADKESCDVTLVVEGKEFQAHKSVLIARSPVFSAMFQHDMAEKKTSTVDIPDCDKGSFSIFLEYLYSGRAGDVSFSSALELYRTAQKYDVPELKSFCTDRLTSAKKLMVEEVTAAVVLADQYDDEDLMAALQDFFNVHFGDIVTTKEWESLHRQDFRLANKLIVGVSSYFSKLTKSKKS